MLRVIVGNCHYSFILTTCINLSLLFLIHANWLNCVNWCNFSLRACAAAALKDVTAYFTKEKGQVAVSKRTTETVPLITINAQI